MCKKWGHLAKSCKSDAPLVILQKDSIVSAAEQAAEDNTISGTPKQSLVKEENSGLRQESSQQLKEAQPKVVMEKEAEPISEGVTLAEGVIEEKKEEGEWTLVPFTNRQNKKTAAASGIKINTDEFSISVPSFGRR